jgi:hypothetical protein
MRTLLILVTSIFCACSAQAEVLIYKGTGRVKAGPPQIVPFPAKINIYVIFDPTAATFGSVLFFNVAGEKKYLDGGGGVRAVSEIAQPHGKTPTLISSGAVNFTSATNYDHAFTYLTGLQKELTIKSSGAGTTVQQPRVLSGTSFTARATNGSDGSFSELALHVVFRSEPTIIANNAGKTADQARADLIAELEAHGFTALTF